MGVKAATWPLSAPRASESEEMVLVGVVDLDCQGEIGRLLNNGGKEEYVRNGGGP